ncbi:MAG: hypothetical protein AAB354_14050 [candidate division KSB1 bacterium]
MKAKRRLELALALGLLATWWGGCTESPFENEIKPTARVIRGQVQLDDARDERAGIYVWMAGANLSARTDSAGKFELQIPNTLVGAGGATLNGIFQVYVYIANYNLTAVEVAVRNGLFEYGLGALDANGNLQTPVRLFKILTITTIVVPTSVAQSYDGPIDMQTTFRATGDSVTIIVPKSVGGLLGGIFFRHRQTGKIFIDIPDEGADTRERIIIGNDPLSRRQVFQLNGTNFRELFLPTGDFEVIPFFFIEQEDLPSGLLESLGKKAEEPAPDYLNIPFRREGGAFQVF